MDISSSFLAQILSSLQLHDPIPLLAISHLLSFLRYESTCRIFEELISWPLSDFAASTFLSQISHSSVTLFTFIILSFFCFFFFSSFFCSFSSCFFSFFFYFCYFGFPCFGIHCFSHSFRHLIIFISPILQSISGLW